MNRPLRWIVPLVLVASVCGVALVGYSWLFVYFFFSEEFNPEKVALSAEKQLDGFDFKVTFFRNHSMLAEYRKIVKVTRGEQLLLEREFIDTGGLATFYFLRQGNRIIVLDGVRNGFVLDLLSGEISKVDIDSLPEKFQEQEVGRFMFVFQEKRSCKWVAKEEIPPEKK